MSNPTTEELVKEWLRLDKEGETRREIQELWDNNDISELESRLRQRIEFGTADKIQAGFSRMNSLTIIQASQGLAAYVSHGNPEAKIKGVVIGHDHRHNSEHWAKLTATIFLSYGFNVYLFQGLVHTPLVPFSVSMLRAACGVMITASHNPKNDNGYKVYWENGVQIIAPHDHGIANAIKDNLEPCTWDTRALQTSPLLHDKTEEIKDAYFRYLKSLSQSSDRNPSTTITFVCTAMHGVGHYYASRAFLVFGFPLFTPLKTQQDPDPDFPTVKFPNPEEKGALDLALKEAERVHADYVMAQDPDADRFTASERNPDGTWKVFSGDMLGAIFAARTLEIYRASGKPISKLAMVASTVSSRMLEAMANKEGFKFSECLTGFKYIGNTALDLIKEGYEVPFAYEEAIGFMFGSEIRDKDGIAATVFFAELVVYLHQQGLTAAHYLNQLYSKYGYFQTSNSYFICRSPPTIDRIFARLRHYYSGDESGYKKYPREIGDMRIVWIRDLTLGYDSANPPTYAPSLPLSSGHMIQFRATSKSGTESIMLTLRTSGTEPKIKYYLEGRGHDITLVQRILTRIVDVLTAEWVQVTQNDLILP
ncbi:hypothetical protein K439DRAFT_1649515 [Ramaria rubella]|nr:hypothetical protein K439DRAFT_1649515 [Ramaria rubella]